MTACMHQATEVICSLTSLEKKSILGHGGTYKITRCMFSSVSTMLGTCVAWSVYMYLVIFKSCFSLIWQQLLVFFFNLCFR